MASPALADRAQRGREIGSALHIPGSDACLWCMCAIPGYEASSEIFEGILGSCSALDPVCNAMVASIGVVITAVEIERPNACLHIVRSCIALCRSKQRRA